VNGVWAIVPVKCFGRGKSRLADVMPAPARAKLARELCEHVLGVLGSCPELGGVLVATDCDQVARFAAGRGAEVVRDGESERSSGTPRSGGEADGKRGPRSTPDAASGKLAPIVDRALAVLAARGAPGALVLMSDLPLLERADVVSLVAALDEAPVVLAPDLLDAGTNALGLAPPDRMASCFGSETSFDRHRARAAERDIPVFVHRSEGTARDLDSPDDLARVCAYEGRGARLSWKRNRSSRVRAA